AVATAAGIEVGKRALVLRPPRRPSLGGVWRCARRGGYWCRLDQVRL
ncbi:MAG: hypothetical protein AVDCRST_MAG08-2664, partial [uncultured Acetobacteraceae bacterium]